MQIVSKGLTAGHFKIIDGKPPQWTNRLDQSSYERPSKNWEHWQSDVGIFRSEAEIKKKKENFVASIQAFCALCISYLVHREINLYSSHDAYLATAYSCFCSVKWREVLQFFPWLECSSVTCSSPPPPTQPVAQHFVRLFCQFAGTQ